MNKLIGLLLIVISLLIGSSAAFAGFGDFKNDLNYANSMRGKIKEKGASFQPGQTFKHYNPNPSQGKYYNGVTQSGDNNLDSDAAGDASQDQAGSTVISAFKIRPIFHVNHNSAAIKKSSLIKNDSYDISHGISDKYVDCKKATHCKTVNVTKVCDEGTRDLDKSCTKTATVKIIVKPYKKHDIFSGHLNQTGANTGTIKIPEDGVITSFSASIESNDIWLCSYVYGATLQGSFISNYSHGCGHWLGGLAFSNNNLHIPVIKGSTVAFKISGPARSWFWGWKNSSYSMTIEITAHRKVPQITWTEVCQDVN